MSAHKQTAETHEPRNDGLPLLESSARQSQSPVFGNKVRSGVFWSAGGNIIMRVSNVLIMAVIARIVAPDELGVFALAMLVHAFIVSIAELGIATAIARSELDVDRLAPTVATIATVGSLGLAGLMAGFAEPLASLLGTSEATDSIRIMSLAVAMIGFFAVPGALLQREFRQDLVFRAAFVSFLVGGVVLLVLGFLGWGPEAFAWSRVVTQLIGGIMLLVLASKKYPFGFDRRLVRPLLAFGLPLAMANLLSQVLLNLDYVFIGQMLQVADLGVYMLAFGLCTWSTAIIGTMLNGMVLPTISAIRRDGGDLASAITTATRSVAWIAFPIAGCMITFADQIVVTLYGEQWTEAGGILRILAAYGAVFVLGLLFANVVISSGKTKVLFIVQAASLALLVPALWLGIRWAGLQGVGVAHLVVVIVVTLPVYLVVLRRSTGLRIRACLGGVLPALGAATVASLLAWAATWGIAGNVVTLVVGLPIGGILYVLMTRNYWHIMLPTTWQSHRILRSRLFFKQRQTTGIPDDIHQSTNEHGSETDSLNEKPLPMSRQRKDATP